MYHWQWIWGLGSLKDQSERNYSLLKPLTILLIAYNDLRLRFLVKSRQRRISGIFQRTESVTMNIRDIYEMDLKLAQKGCDRDRRCDKMSIQVSKWPNYIFPFVFCHFEVCDLFARKNNLYMVSRDLKSGQKFWKWHEFKMAQFKRKNITGPF